MLMSTASLRYRSVTLSFLPYKRDHRLSKSLRSVRIRASRRRAKRAYRNVISRIQTYA